MSLRQSIIKNLIIIQMFLLSLGVVFIITVFFDGEDALHEALIESESQGFLTNYSKNKDTPLPNTLNISSYIGLMTIPDQYASVVKDLKTGIHILNTDSGSDFNSEKEARVIIKTIDNSNDLFYLFSEIPDIESDNIIQRKIIIIIVVYIVITGVLGIWLAYFFSKKISSPIERMSEIILNSKNYNPLTNLSAITSANELHILAGTIDDKNRRIYDFIQREQNIIKNISHELRTPVTILKSSLSLLKIDPCNNGEYVLDKKLFNKIERVSNDLESTIEAFLWLGREKSDKWETQITPCAQLIEKAVLNHSYLLENKEILVSLNVDDLMTLDCKDSIFYIVIANLIRNAFTFTCRGEIRIELSNYNFVIQDSGAGLIDHLNHDNMDKTSFGLGLGIVQQICERMKWEFNICNVKNANGTIASINFINSMD